MYIYIYAATDQAGCSECCCRTRACKDMLFPSAALLSARCCKTHTHMRTGTYICRQTHSNTHDTKKRGKQQKLSAPRVYTCRLQRVTMLRAL